MSRSAEAEGFIPPHDGYARLVGYQKALVVFQATARFCERFLRQRDRTVDQMIQAAQSGKRNIVEGHKVSGPSKEAEIKLIIVARSSFEELLEDYRDFLRNRSLRAWPKDSPEAVFVRKLGTQRMRHMRRIGRMEKRGHLKKSSQTFSFA